MKLSLAACISIYEDYFKTEMPKKLTYTEAVQKVIDELGQTEFLKRYGAYLR